VALGCAGEETIRVLHGIPFLEAEGTRIGRLEGNPLHVVLERIARDAGLRFVVNVAYAPDGALLGAAAGSPSRVLGELASRLLPVTWARVGREPFDAVLAGVPPSKSASLYQVSRALTYTAFSPHPVLRQGGMMVLAARCPEGAGQGPGEREFLAAFRPGDAPTATVERLRAGGFGAGGQRAFMVARALARHPAMIVGALVPGDMRRCGFLTVATPEEAVEQLRAALGARARVLVVPQALAQIPVAEDPEHG
jgi:nickel-dependent lactate racemase